MRTVVVFLMLVGVAAPLHAAAGAQSRTARADVCVTIDDAHDALSPQERTAATVLVSRQFELAGRRVVSGSCAEPYTVSHVRLGETIVVILSGADDRREGTARGLDDLPALYSQMVRSMVTGRPMTGFNVVDRTNVTASQASPQRVQSDSFAYARLGYGAIFGNQTQGVPSVGLLGYRHEVESFGIDVSFMNFQFKSANGAYSSTSSSGSWIKLEALHLRRPAANQTTYLGGGLSWGGTSSSDNGLNRWEHSGGSGLQGELTAGYEVARASTVRLFVQADATLPFYTLTSNSYSSVSNTRPSVTTRHQYAPSLAISMGLGWQRNRRR